MNTDRPQAMNACVFCKHGKRKCDKARPACSNCLRLRKPCVYTEDTIQTSFESGTPRLEQLKRPTLPMSESLFGINPSTHDTFQQSMVDMVMRTFGSLSNIGAISREFFTGTHQRTSAISKPRFERNLLSLSTQPRADFAALCLTILLMQQTPMGKATNMQSSLYLKVKNLITLLDTQGNPSLDHLHCRILVAFYEMGHGLHGAAYISLAASARAARVLGLHRKRWRKLDADPDKLLLEEEKRTWWAIVLMDRFINLCNGDAFPVTEDPARTDPLPIDDLLWAEGSTRADLERLVDTAPFLDTPFNITVGQLARECQISNLVGHVSRHVFDPVSDSSFNSEGAVQLERTLKAYLPLLSNEELKVGKYCGAYGMCNSALFVLYEYMLSRNPLNEFDRQRILQSIEETALGTLTFAEASYSEREENYPADVHTPYLPYSLCQAAMVYHRLWTESGNPIYKQRLDTLRSIVSEFTKRWMVAWQYLETIDNLDNSFPSIGSLPPGQFIGGVNYRY